MSAEEERLLNLLDSYWFEYGIFSEKPSFSAAKPADEDPDALVEVEEKRKLNRIKTLLKKSSSDQFLSSRSLDCSDNSPSPNSVLVHKLQTILSGKEHVEEELDEEKNESQYTNKKNRVNPRTQRRRRNGSRSLSEIEFEELKGFMDLGFVFSDEDKDSDLVSIIPGLQRLGKWDDEKPAEVSRPYLSEAWDVLEDEEEKRLMKKRPLMKKEWRIPNFGNEMELKDHLRFWAHTVASTVR